MRGEEAFKAPGRLQVVYDSRPVEITEHEVDLEVAGVYQVVPNDFVWIFAGGLPPTELLEEMRAKPALPRRPSWYTFVGVSECLLRLGHRVPPAALRAPEISALPVGSHAVPGPARDAEAPLPRRFDSARRAAGRRLPLQRRRTRLHGPTIRRGSSPPAPSPACSLCYW